MGDYGPPKPSREALAAKADQASFRRANESFRRETSRQQWRSDPGERAAREAGAQREINTALSDDPATRARATNRYTYTPAGGWSVNTRKMSRDSSR